MMIEQKDLIRFLIRRLNEHAGILGDHLLAADIGRIEELCFLIRAVMGGADGIAVRVDE